MNYWKYSLIREILGKKRSRLFWNILFGSVVVILICCAVIPGYRLLSENIVYESEEVYLCYEDGKITTESGSYKIEGEESYIKRSVGMIESGELIKLTISSISGEIIRIDYLDIPAYEKECIPVVVNIIGLFFVMCFAFLVILLIYAINTKKRGKFIDKIRKDHVFSFPEDDNATHKKH